ncbi:hypothetical protein L6164_033393 [Bauhinia variegata]|uniref:Uncharacterized protein n=1 Tax=Bauhinia variegata TaxID=167791 RepID=A0ACB9KRZ2_BAUVA|nr:hypothetical protein L6164_033393 [Bauhinia variegata]
MKEDTSSIAEGNPVTPGKKLKSFSGFHNYVQALLDTPFRLLDRVTARSMDETELVEMKGRSQHDMKRTLSWWDLIWFGMGGVVGAGIFVLTGQEAKTHAGPAVVLSYVISGTSAMFSAFCYTEFAVEIPVAGGSFAYLRVELGDFVAYIAAGNILLEYVIAGAAVARSWTSYLATLCNKDSDFFLIKANHLANDYNQLDPIAVGVLVVVCVVAIFSTKGTSRFNYIASIFHIAVLLFIIVGGLIKADAKNLKDFAPFKAHGIFQSAAVLFFAYVGFDAVSTLAEETKNPGKDIPIGLVGSMVITTVLYCLLALSLCLMQNYANLDDKAAFSVAFQAVGWGWAKYIVAAGALKGMTSVLLVGAVGQARYLTHIARTQLLPQWLAKVNERTGTPIYATTIMISATAVVAFFTELNILANLLSVSTLFLFALVALALLVRRYYSSGVTSRKNLIKLIVFILTILGSSIASAVYWANSKGWVGYIIVLPLWLVGTIGIWLFVPIAKKPKVWGVPFVPFLPSASIAINIFLLGSIDKASFVRFGIWTGVLLIYYLFVGLHASYDVAQEQRKKKEDTTKLKLDEEKGVSPVVDDSQSQT